MYNHISISDKLIHNLSLDEVYFYFTCYELISQFFHDFYVKSKVYQTRDDIFFLEIYTSKFILSFFRMKSSSQ